MGRSSRRSGSTGPEVLGFLNIHKPLGITAHDVVARIRKILRIKQVGHGGTLDPMAEGVLPIAVGKATRLLRFLDGTKVYLAEIQLGMRTTTDDMEGEILPTAPDGDPEIGGADTPVGRHLISDKESGKKCAEQQALSGESILPSPGTELISRADRSSSTPTVLETNRAAISVEFSTDRNPETPSLTDIQATKASKNQLISDGAAGTSAPLPSAEKISSALREFVGHIQQFPPMYSAVHVNGRRLYEMARAGELPEEIPLRSVFVESIEELGYEPPVVRLRITCGAGTYIRSIARDLGDKLGCGGCLKSLVREGAGALRIDNSTTLEQLHEAVADDKLTDILIAPPAALPLPKINIDAEQTFKLKRGQSCELSPEEVRQAAEHVVALYEGKIVAVCRWGSEPGDASVRIQPEVVLADGQTG